MILKAEKIEKAYLGTQILKGVSLSVEKGESIAICGKSGEGKTTLLHILGALEKPDKGQVELLGPISFVFQSYNLLEDFTVLENVLMPAKIARKKISLETGLNLLRKVGLEHRANVSAKLLSGGEKQRATLARALLSNPDLILADEPTGNLDQESAEMVGEMLFSLVKEEGKSLILVTHNPELASRCDKRYTLHSGNLSLWYGGQTSLHSFS